MGHLRPFTLLAFTDLPFTKSASLGEIGDLSPERLIYLQLELCQSESLCLLVSSRIISLMIRQVMSPSSNALPDTVPTSPLLGARPIHDRSISQLAFIVLGLFTILQWLTAKDWSYDTATVNDLYQFTGTHTCRHTLSLTHLAQFTASFFLTTYYRFNFAAACTNATITTIMVATLASVPSRVYPPLRGTRCPAHAGGSELAGGSDGESHLTRKQTDRTRRLPVLLLLLPLFTTHTAHQCRQAKPLDFESTLRRSPPREESKILLYRGFPDTASEGRNGLRTVKGHRWAKRAHLYPLFALLLLTCPAQ